MSAQGSNTSGAEATAKDFWSSRPQRPRAGRKIAGVAAGIGRRYGIDPVIIRVALVLATLFGGAGIPVYLLCWLLLPKEGDEVSPFESLVGRGRSSTSGLFTVLLCLALIPATSGVFGASWFFGGHFSGFLGAAMLMGGLYLLQRGRGDHATLTAGVAEPVATGAPRGDDAEAEEPAAARPERQVGEEAERTTPPSWDPLGAAPFAWDLPDPGPAPDEATEPEPGKRRSRIGLLTLGVALVAIAICVAIAPLTGGWMDVRHGIGIVLGVLGLGMVGGAFSGGGRGLTGPAVILAVVGILMTSGHTGADASGGIGNQHYVPERLGAVRDAYHSTAGSFSLNLTRLPDHGSVTTSVHNTVGQITVRVPMNADVTASCHAQVGDVICLRREQSGFGPHVDYTGFGPDGPGGLKIKLDVHTNAGNVEVTRG